MIPVFPVVLYMFLGSNFMYLLNYMIYIWNGAGAILKGFGTIKSGRVILQHRQPGVFFQVGLWFGKSTVTMRPPSADVLRLTLLLCSCATALTIASPNPLPLCI